MEFESQGRQSNRTRSLWLPLAAGPVIWSIHLVGSYALVSLSCNWGFLQFRLFGIPGIRAVLILVSAALALAVYYAGYAAYRTWRMRAEHSPLEDHEKIRLEDRFQFMAYSATLLNGLFGTAILISIFPIILVRACP